MYELHFECMKKVVSVILYLLLAYYYYKTLFLS